MNKEIFIECDCYSEGIKLNYQDDLLYISLYQRGFKPRTKTIKEKLRWIWQIIIKDVPYDDELIISKDKIKQLSQFVNGILPNNTQFVNENRPNNIELKRGTLYKIQGEDMPFRYVEYSSLVNTKNDGLYHFKYHQLKTYTFSKSNLNKVEREANDEEIRIYNLTKEGADRIWKNQK
jgi:hypothetical protein